MRYLGIDLGDKRTGIAVGDSVLRLATPVEAIHVPLAQNNGESLLEAIEKSAVEQLGRAAAGEGEVVMGLPMNMDGTEGARAKLAREFAARLETRLGRVVHLFDERLTTAAADWSLSMSGLTHKQKKERRDALAAAAMLQGFLDANARRPRDDEP